MLENLVIPNLLAGAAERQNGSDALAAAPLTARTTTIPEADITAFAELSVRADAHHMLAFVEAQLGHGHSVEALYVQLLAPAARRLGEYWEQDREDFVTVTMALWRIQEVLRELTLKVPPPPRPGAFQRSALFSNLPGDQHSFGLLMVADCFERAGWQADVLIEPQRPELTGKFACQHYDLIGLTISSACPNAALAELVTTIRTVSRNPGIKVLIGGGEVMRHPELVAASGADGTAADAADAVALANQMVPSLTALPHA